MKTKESRGRPALLARSLPAGAFERNNKRQRKSSACIARIAKALQKALPQEEEEAEGREKKTKTCCVVPSVRLPYRGDGLCVEIGLGRDGRHCTNKAAESERKNRWEAGEERETEEMAGGKCQWNVCCCCCAVASLPLHNT